MSTTPSSPWLVTTPQDDRNSPSVSAGVEYHRVLAGEDRRILRGLLAIFLVAVGLVVFSLGTGALATLVDTRLGNDPQAYTPARHAASMIGLGLLLPWSMLLQRWLYGVPGASLHSVSSRFRFDLFGKALLVFGPAWLVVNTVAFFLPAEEVPWSQAELVAMFLLTILLTPLQTTGEEYGVRGLAFRVIGSWTRNARAGLVAGIVVTSVLFTLMHGSTDPYIITWYLTLFTCLAIITWRTGGLEIAVVLHAILNTSSFLAAILLRIDFGAALGDRSAGVGSPSQLLPALAVLIITVIICWWTRRTGPVLTPASGSRVSQHP
ncbi:CPBP family intramembrane glutamic endopeptidase [Occultella aeris]|uniref:CAAX amino terminal protease self- immunity n=1 Tax=Occultella aeris TaxID=2761496 RepID=A0A7M4DD67_9MICO|nr:type II CAAX endopeptidase family protein [Occultella aeris]VZO34786.1 CAAX amino terminal protease self- immunity [Occultella aeris]